MNKNIIRIFTKIIFNNISRQGMENKKLINILTKDMAELEELISEMKVEQHFDVIDLEFVHTRVKGVLHLLQLLGSTKGTVVSEAEEGKGILDKLKDKADKVSRLTSEIKAEPKQEVVENLEESSKQQEQELPGVVPTPSEDEDDDENAEEEPNEEPENHTESDEEMLQETNENLDKSSRLGESFLKSKSINDMITGQAKQDYKLSNRPVSSIQSAIGINDRFQYIRELFDGDNKKFLETVKTIDSMNNINEAVQYLRNHFKWKRNETSLKFVNLVKRRFQSSQTV